jgi:hypothetical protein
MPGIVTAWPIFPKVPKHIFELELRNSMLMDMRLARFGVFKITNVHAISEHVELTEQATRL